VQAYSAHLGAAWSTGNLLSIVTAGATVIFSSLVTLVMGASLVVCLLALFCVTYTANRRFQEGSHGLKKSGNVR